ncbi:MAG: ester cyclase [Bacteroidota bacterium]
MSTEQNKSIVRRWVEEGWNKGNAALIDQLFTPDFYQHETGPETVTSSEALKQFHAGYLAAIPDLQFTVDDLVAEGDRVAWRFQATGHQNGPLMGVPASGKAVAVTGIIIFRFEGSRIAEAWLNLDVLGLLQQVGIIPAAA